MKKNSHKYVASVLTFRVVGYAMTVLNVLGHGLREKTYERALSIELQHQGLLVEKQLIYPIHYQGEHIDDYIPDIVVGKKLIVEVKTTKSIAKVHVGQVLNYLKVSGLEAGVILNFKYPRLQWKKVVLQSGHSE